MPETVKVAAAQFEPHIFHVEANLSRMLLLNRTAAQNGAKLIVFPECALTGYMFHSREEATPCMETIPGPSTLRIESSCRELGVYTVYGLLERDGSKCYNTAALIGPQGLIGKYRKSHLPFLGVDRYLDRGEDPLHIYSTAVGNLGMHICYDCNFPEIARVLALNGADILVLPTNWPQGRGVVPRLIVPARAYENHVYVVAVNRVGEERTARFIGESKIINPLGDTLAQATGACEEIIYADLDLTIARQKHMVIKPGEFEMDFFQDRRPELYGRLTESVKDTNDE
jgi:5-aminopentanamidase